MKTELFRKTSIDRLSSPEQLDQLLTVTTPRAWLMLVGAICVFGAALVWSFMGKIPTKIYGAGILAKSGGIYNVSHIREGRMTDIAVEVGENVKKGEVIGRIDVYELVEQINMLKEEVDDLLKEDEESAEQSKLIGNLNRKIQRLQQELIASSQIVSPVEGRILEIKANKGDILQIGQEIVSIERSASSMKDLEVILYIPAEEGKHILPGMDTQVSPTIVKKEEYGYLMGKVVSVSEYPTTQTAMMLTLGNEELAKKLSGQGAPIQVHIDLIPDERTESGYRWSSPAGPPIKINSGTMCTGSVTIHHQRPIEMLLPFIKQLLPNL